MPNLELVANNKYRTFYPHMERDELIGYCDLHRKSQRALFSREMIAQMVEYAGCPEDFPNPQEIMRYQEFIGTHEPMKKLVDLARSQQT